MKKLEVKHDAYKLGVKRMMAGLHLSRLLLVRVFSFFICVNQMSFDRFSRGNGRYAKHVHDCIITLNDCKGMKLSFVHFNYFIQLFIAGDKMYIPVISVITTGFVQISLPSFVLLVKTREVRFDLN